MAAVTSRAVRWTVDEYTRMAGLLAGRRTELLDGQIIEMAPIGTAHYTVTSRLLRMLGTFALEGRLAAGDPVIVTNFDEPQPDLCLLRHPVELRKIVPDDIAVLIEVSDITYLDDIAIKLPRYLEAGVPQVWIFNISMHDKASLEMYRLGENIVEVRGVVYPFRSLPIDLDVLFDGLATLPPDEYDR